MDRKARKYLYDVRQACERIAAFTRGRTFDEYVSDDMLRSAVERQFEIVGEALNGLARVDPPTAALVTDRQRIVAFRNILIHGYADVDHRIVWGVVEAKLALLREEVRRLLGDG